MRQPLLLLHGALGAASQLQPLATLLTTDFDVHTFSFAGHGGQPLDAARFTMTHFAAEVSHYLAAHGLDGVHVFGYSMGGYAALLSAASDPGRIRSLTTLGTKFDWSPETAEAETRMLNPEKMQAKIPGYVAQLSHTHAPTEWNAVVDATAAMLRELGETPVLNELNLSQLSIPVQVLVGELDTTAGVEASRQFAAYLPEATFEVFPNTPHPLEKTDLAAVARRIREFAGAAR